MELVGEKSELVEEKSELVVGGLKESVRSQFGST